MDRYTKAFVVTSLVWFAAAAGLGAWMATTSACFSCPGQATETVRQSAMMHNAREEQLLRELNEAAGLAA